MDRSTNDFFSDTYGRVFSDARLNEGLQLIRPFNDPWYRQNHRQSAEFPNAEHYAAWVVGTLLTDREVLGLHQTIANDFAPQTAHFRALMRAPVAERANQLQPGVATVSGPSSRVPSARRRSAAQPSKRPRTAAVASALAALKAALGNGEFAKEDLINDIAGEHKVQYAYLRSVAKQQGLYEGIKRTVTQAVPSPAPRIKQEPVDHSAQDLRFWNSPAPAQDGDPVFDRYLPASSIVGFNLDERGELQPVFGEHADGVAMFVRRVELGYNRAYNRRFPIRAENDPRYVHPQFASPLNPRETAPGITVERVDIRSSGTELLQNMLQQSSQRRPDAGIGVTQSHVRQAQATVEWAIANELGAVLAGNRPPSEAYSRVDQIRPGQVPSHESALHGQRGLFATPDCPDVRTGIIGIFGGAYAQDTRHVERRYGQDNVDAYSLELPDYVVSPYGGGNDMQYANTAIRAPHSRTRQNIAYDTGRINASFMPAMVTFRRDGRTFEMPVAAVVGHPGMIQPGQEIRLDYGEHYLNRFREAAERARYAEQTQTHPQAQTIKTESSEVDLNAQETDRRYDAGDAARLQQANAGQYTRGQSRGPQEQYEDRDRARQGGRGAGRSR